MLTRSSVSASARASSGQRCDGSAMQDEHGQVGLDGERRRAEGRQRRLRARDRAATSRHRSVAPPRPSARLPHVTTPNQVSAVRSVASMQVRASASRSGVVCPTALAAVNSSPSSDGRTRARRASRFSTMYQCPGWQAASASSRRPRKAGQSTPQSWIAVPCPSSQPASPRHAVKSSRVCAAKPVFAQATGSLSAMHAPPLLVALRQEPARAGERGEEGERRARRDRRIERSSRSAGRRAPRTA